MPALRLYFVILATIVILSGCRESFQQRTPHESGIGKPSRTGTYRGYIFREPPFNGSETTEFNIDGSTFRECIVGPDKVSLPSQCEFQIGKKSEISLYFENFSTEEGYDIVYIQNERHSMNTMYHGSLGNFWSEPVIASKVSIRYQPDETLTGTGFRISRIRIRPVHDSELSGSSVYKEFDVSYESQHNAQTGPDGRWVEEVAIRQPGAEEIAIHFSLMSINNDCTDSPFNEPCPAKILILNRDRRVISNFSKTTLIKDAWITVPGETAYISYQLNTGRTGGILEPMNVYGYKADRLRVKSRYPVYRYASKYPIVFAHGLFGFNNIMGLDYFFRVQKYLEDKGFEVYMTEVPPVSSIQTRADYLAKQIDMILEESSLKNGRRIDKINFIGHSMGGLDGRLLISANTNGYSANPDPRYHIRGRNMGNKFASFVTIGTPHHGSFIADILQGWVPNQDVKKTAVSIIRILSTLYNYNGPDEKEVIAASFELTEKFCQQFNIDHPEPENRNIRYMSFAGVTSAPYPERADADEVNPILFPTYVILSLHPDEKMRANDGMVSFASAKWKDKYYQNYQGRPLLADHLNEVGQLLGQTDPQFNYLEFYHYIADKFE